MDSVTDIVEEGAVPRTNTGESQSQSHMDPDLFNAAAKGLIGHFKQLKNQHFELEKIITATFKNTILHIHIKSQSKSMKSTEFVEQILDVCPKLLLQVNEKRDTPLHVAAKYGLYDVVNVLIQRAKSQGEDIQLESGQRPQWEMLKMINADKNTALHEAIIGGTALVAELLIKEGDPDFSYSANNLGETPLHLAAARGYSSLVREILFRCKSAAYEGPHGKTALHAAAQSCSNYATSMIIEKKKSLAKEIDQHGWTPLHYAAYYGEFDIAKLLLESDKSAANIREKGREMTALHMAAGQGHLKIIKEIISQCPECYDLVDNRGWNFLHFAMISLKKGELINLLKYPLVNSLINDKDGNGNTPLHVLAITNKGSLIYVLDGNVQAVNKQNVRVTDILVKGCSELEKEIEKLSEDFGKEKQYPEGVILGRTILKKRQREAMKEIKEAHLVAATLIATVTFAAAFTVPGGYNSENDSPNQGTAILIKNSAFKAFIISDTMAMTMSLSAVFLHFYMSVTDTLQNQDLYVCLFVAAVHLTQYAMLAMVLAFVTGTYAVLTPSSRLAIANGVIPLFFFGTSIAVLKKMDPQFSIKYEKFVMRFRRCEFISKCLDKISC